MLGLPPAAPRLEEREPLVGLRGGMGASGAASVMVADGVALACIGREPATMTGYPPWLPGPVG